MDRLLLAVGLTISATVVRAAPILYTVDPTSPISSTNFHTISDATAAETPGNSYTIDVAAGTYMNDFPVINQPTDIEATPGTVTLSANMANNQGIIETFANLTVNGLTITGAFTNPGAGDNAAAIRDHNNGSANANTLIVTNSVLENSQNGILTAGSGNQENVTIKGTTFLNDGSGAGDTHALYVGDAASLDVENSISCGTNNGHDIKSRATTTTVSGSTLYVGATGPGCAVAGTTGAGIDAPNGGVVDLVNDSIIQGPTNSNGALIIMGGESPLLANNALTITNTTLSGDGASDSIGVNELSGCIAPVSGSGNTVSGLNKDINPAGCGSLNAAVAVDEPRPLGILASALALLAFSRWKRERPGLMPGCAGAGLGDRARRAAPGFIMRG